MKKIIEKAKHKVKIKEKALKRKVNILGEELGKNISVETVKRFFRYILKGPKRFINKLKNSGSINDYISDNHYDIDDVDERPVIKKVEEDEYTVPKKTRKEKLKELEEAKKRLDKAKPKYRRVSLEDDE